MISKELKKLSRRELVDIIYQLKKNDQEKQEEITRLENALQEKRIRVSVAGSIAEAATDLTQIFSTAQRTADIYLREIAAMKEDTENECAVMREDTEKACAAMLEEARKKVEATLANGELMYSSLNARYQAEYKKYQQLMAELQRLEDTENAR